MRFLVFMRMRFCVGQNLADHRFGFQRRVIGRRQRYVVWQPHVQIEPILNILWKELLLEMGSKNAANDKKHQGAKQDDPAVRDRAPDQPVVKAVEAPLALLFNTEFFLFSRSLNVVAQEWNERHRNNERAQ